LADSSTEPLETTTSALLTALSSTDIRLVIVDLRREDYRPYEMLPAGVLYILAFWDVQKNRVEGEIVGYGLNAQTWGLGYYVFKGSPLVPPNVGVWAEIERTHQLTNFPHPGGGPNLRISGGLVDCGNWKDSVCAFTRPRAKMRIFASRGSSSQRGIVGHKAPATRRSTFAGSQSPRFRSFGPTLKSSPRRSPPVREPHRASRKARPARRQRQRHGRRPLRSAALYLAACSPSKTSSRAGTLTPCARP